MSGLLRSVSTAILAGSLLTVPFVAHAAAPTVRTIPLTNPDVRVVLAPDGKTVAVFTDSVSDTSMLSTAVDPTRLPIALFDVASGRQVASLEGFTDYARAVAFTPDSNRLAVYHGNGRLDVWSLVASKPRRVKAIETLEPFVNNAVFLPDGRTLVAVGANDMPQRFRFWDTRSGAMTAVMGRHFDTLPELYSVTVQFPGRGDVMYTTFTISPDGRTLAAATINDEVQLWAVPDGQPVSIRQASEQPASFRVRQLAFTSGGKRLVYFDGSDGKTHIWDVASGSETATLPFGGQRFALSADGKQLAWATAVGDTTTVSLVGLSGADQPAVVATLPFTLTPVSTLAFTANGKDLVAGGFAPRADGTNAVAIVTLE